MKRNITLSNSASSYLKRLEREKSNSALRILFTVAGADFSQKENRYTLNGVTGINNEEMASIYNHKEAVYRLTETRALEGCAIRTIFPCNGKAGVRLATLPLHGERSFAETPLEILKCGNTQTLDGTDTDEMIKANCLRGTFCDCQALHIVYPINITDCSTISSDTFKNCSALNELRLFGLKHDIDLSYSANMSYKSLKYMVDNATGKITITIHPDTYKYYITRLESPVHIGGTKAEWEALHKRADKKGICFTTLLLIAYIRNDSLNINKGKVDDGILRISATDCCVEGETVVFS